MKNIQDENYLSLIHLLPDIFYKIDVDGNFTHLSDSISLLNYTVEDLIGSHFAAIIHPDDRSDGLYHLNKKSDSSLTGPSSGAALFQEKRTGERATRGLKIRLIKKGFQAAGGNSDTSNIFHGELFSTGIYTDNLQPAKEKFLGSIGLIRDINEQLKTEEAIVRTEKHYRSLIENSTDIISIIGTDGTILFQSPSLKNVLKYNEYDLIGESIYEFINTKDHRNISNFFNRNFDESNVPTTIEYSFKDTDGEWHELESIGKSVGDTREQIMCFIMNTRDITERKKAEKVISDSLREKEILLSELHHRVKNNFQIIHSLLNLQAKSIKVPSALDIINDFKTRIKSMAMIHEKLYLSDNLATINFREYITAMAREIIQVCYKSDKAVDLKLDIKQVFLPLDRVIPCALLLNEVLTNSLKHAFPDNWEGNPSISIALIQKDKDYVLTIKDNGIGIPEGVKLSESPSLGFTIIPLLAQQMKAGLKLEREGGTIYTVSLRVD